MIVRNTNPYEFLQISDKSKIRVHGSHLYLISDNFIEYNLTHVRCPLFHDNGRKICRDINTCINKLTESYPDLVSLYTEWSGLHIHFRVGFKLLVWNMTLYESVFMKYRYEKLNKSISSDKENI